MRELQYEELGKEKLVWIYPEHDGQFEFVDGEPEAGRVAVKIRYLSQGDSELLGRRLIAKGILKKRIKHGNDTTDWVYEQQAERNRMFAEAMVVDLQGLMQGKERMPYSPEIMAQAFKDISGLFDAVSKASKELDAFFARNGTGSSEG